MYDNYYALIMAGGGGTRLWPLSRKNRPKQMLSLVDEQSMFRISVERLLPLLPPERIFIVTGQNMVDDLRHDVPEIPAENYVLEPFGMDTAPAVGYGIMRIAAHDPDAIVAVLTADHYIANEVKFRDVLKAAYQAATDDYIVTLGITPSHPSTGFGYIERGDHLTTLNDFHVYQSVRFREKPNEETAIEFLSRGNFSWNAGMFIWKAARALGELRRQRPTTFYILEKIQGAFGTDTFEQVLAEQWPRVEKLPIDIAVMENAENVAVIPVDIGWDDIGSWSALYDALCDDDGAKRQNIYRTNGGNVYSLDSRGNLVLTERTVVTLGVEDMVIIDTGDVVFVCDRAHAQGVKAVVNHLKDQHRTDLL